MIATYSSTEVIFTFGGYNLSDWERITINRSFPTYRSIQGIRGKNSRVRTKNTAADIEVEVSQTSEINYIFSKIVELDDKIGNGKIIITIKDSLNGEIFSTQEAYVEGFPTRNYQGDITTRVWKICCMSSETTYSDTTWSITSLFGGF